MLSTKIIAAVAATMAFTAVGIGSAAAAPYGSGYKSRTLHTTLINYRIRKQARRIARGRQSGRLNWVEARRARFELSHIRGFRARYMNNGWLNRREARHLNRLLKDNSFRIRRFATNGNTGRGWRAGKHQGRQTAFNRYNGFD